MTQVQELAEDELKDLGVIELGGRNLTIGGTEYIIPRGISLEIPDALASMILIPQEGHVIQIETLHKLLDMANGFTLPADITITITLSKPGRPSQIESSNQVAAQLLQFFIEAHHGDYFISQDPNLPSLSVNNWQSHEAGNPLHTPHPTFPQLSP